MYEVIYHDKIKTILEQEIVKVRDNLQIISAYCKISAISYVDSKVSAAPVTKRVMVRFRLDDILSGATDLEIYEYCQQNGWDLYIQLDLHAKTFIFDRKRWMVGSANLTSKGIGLAENSNLEMAMLADVDSDELIKINAIFDNSTLMSEHLYQLMKKQVAQASEKSFVSQEWNDEIQSLVKDDIAALFTQDFPKSKTPFPLIPDDLLLLQLPIGTTDLAAIRRAFTRCRGFRWLVSLLNTCETRQMYFGAISAKLHEILVNDPKPYRKEVKDLLGNLLNWVVELEIESIIIERPSHSQLISLVS